MQLNRILLIGNLTRDPETRHTSSGAQVTNFTLAVNDRRGGKEETMFIRVETWNKTAEIAERFLKKGSQVLVEGKLKIDEYETRDGQKRRDPVVRADRMELGSRPREEGGGGGRSFGGDREASSRRDRPSESYDDPYGGMDEPRRDYHNEGADTGPAGTEDDLPF